MRNIKLNSIKSVIFLTLDRNIDRRILLQAGSLENSGWNVTIIAMPRDLEGEQDTPRVVRINTQGKDVIREKWVLTVYQWLRQKLPINSRMIRIIRQLAWRFFLDPESFYLKLFSQTVALYSPQVFVAADLPMLPVARQAALRCGALVVYDSHELYCEQEFSKQEKNRWTKIEKKYINACYTVVTVNSSIASELKNRYGIGNVKVISNADRIFQQPNQSLLFHDAFGLTKDRKILLFQGGLSAGRHLETLIEAMTHVHNPKVDLVVLGEGLLQQKLKAKVCSKKLTNRVYFHPAVCQQDLLRYTAAASGGIIPYQATCLNNYYCTPNKLFEFIAAGIPILASDLPEISKMLLEHKIGLVGDMSTAQNLAQLIDDFFNNEHSLDSWRRNCVIARESVCWEKEEKKWLKIFEELQ